tara:strand:- start:309 stop:809 length:501 start_codon:yes stop_codon:yes gene_type:complete
MPETALETKVAILQNDMKQMEGLFGRLDTAIDKMSEVSNSINQLLAVHEERIGQAERETEDLFGLMEKRRVEQEEASKELHSRITSQSREIQKEVKHEVDRLGELMTKQHEEVKEVIETRNKQQDDEISDLEDRIRNIEKKQWIVMGGAIVIAWIGANIPAIIELF